MTDMTLPPSLRSAQLILQELIAQGVRHVVISPGSRSAPLAYAAYCAQQAGKLEVHVKIDERSAGFFALGLGKASGVPAAVVTTSGTAVANLHPAVLEAHHASVPMIVLSADRPHELHGTGANQTTEQRGMFGSAVRLAVDLPAPSDKTADASVLAVVARAIAATLGMGTGYRGPVQMNCGFADPLAPTADQLALLRKAFDELRPEPHTQLLRFGAHQDRFTGASAAPRIASIEAEPYTVVIAGDSAPQAASQLARSQGWPLIAEPSSSVVSQGVPHGPLVLEHAADLVAQTRQVIVFGRPTLTRQVQRLMAHPDTKLVVVTDSGAPFVDPSRTADAVLFGIPDRWYEARSAVGEPHWADAWGTASAKITRALGELTGVAPTFAAHEIAQHVADSVLNTSLLLVGSSSVIRDLDLYATWPAPAQIYANRGLAGIDGTVSTALGIAASVGKPMRAIMGDLTFLHDIGGLLNAIADPGADLDIIVINDQGGAIFAGLEHWRAGDPALFDQMFTTPHAADLGKLCAGYGVDHVKVAPQELGTALQHAPHGIKVIEVMLEAENRKRAQERLKQALARTFSPADSANSQ